MRVKEITVRHSYQNTYGDMNTHIAIISGKHVELVPAIEINDCAFLLYYSRIKQIQSHPKLLGPKVKV
jgi:hypothetical protein